MSDRFEKLYSLPNQLYSPSAPVMITAGALLKDTQTGKVLAQLKIKNISPKIIKAVSISLVPLDTSLQPLDEKETHQLSDLSVQQGAEFGQKTPLYFSDYATRAFQVIVENVVFADNTTWKSDGTPLSNLPPQRLAADALADAELEKQYGLEYGESAAYVGDTCFDLWRCKCGAINHDDEAGCHSCNTQKAAALSFDLERLKSTCRVRVEKEMQEQVVREEAAKKAKRRNIVLLAVITATVVAFMSVSVADSTINKKLTEECEKSLDGAVFIINKPTEVTAERQVLQVKGIYTFSATECRIDSTNRVNKGGNSWQIVTFTTKAYPYHVVCQNYGKDVYVILDRDKESKLPVTEIKDGKIQKMSDGDIELILRE